MANYLLSIIYYLLSIYDQLPTIFLKRSNLLLLLLWVFIGFYLFFKVVLIRNLPLIFFSFLKHAWSYYLLVIIIIKIVTLHSLWLSTILQTFQPCHCQNLEDQKKFPKKPGDLVKKLGISADGKLRWLKWKKLVSHR